MTTLRDRETFNAIKNLLLFYMEDHNEREALVESALYGCSILKQIDWSGSSAVFTAHLIERLLEFGECKPDRPAIILLLEELKSRTGLDKHLQIDALIQAYTLHTSHLIEVKPPIISARELPSLLSHLQSIDIMPGPFAWIDIPAGKVTLEAGGYLDKETTFDVPAFQIAKYPITNAQFAKFIEAGGYKEKRWWTEGGWEAREQGIAYVDTNWKATGKAWTEPRYWQDAKWSGAEQPVVGVSWYESVAFCQWLSETAGEKVMMPTEQQWQRAAQGDKGLKYPWGNKWDRKRCNNSVRESIKQTTPVRQYEGQGDSLYGVVDMAGNVWEWCLTSRDDGIIDIHINTLFRMLRGGAFFNIHTVLFRCIFYYQHRPHNRSVDMGFRLARSI